MNKYILKCPHCGLELKKFEISEEYGSFIFGYIYNNCTDRFFCYGCENDFNMVEELIKENVELKEEVEELRSENKDLIGAL